jgi:predicted dehydrogenase
MGEHFTMGLIGCGYAGEQHARVYAALDAVHLQAVADTRVERAASMARKTGAGVWHRDYRSILRDPEIDAVSICLPHYLHAKVTVEAANSGKHVLCEKPMANTLNEARDMVAAAHDAAVTLMIAETVRFHPINLRLRELLGEGLVGDVFFVRIARDHEMHDYLRSRPWFLDKAKAGGGIWMSGGIHDVDALRMLVGEVETITMCQAKKVLSDMEGDDTVAALLRFVGGALGVVTESFSTKTFARVHPNGCPSVINGESGTLTVFMDEVELYRPAGSVDEATRLKITRGDPFTEEIRHFLHCLRTGGTPITSGEEAMKTLAVICAGYDSVDRGGVPIAVTEVS